MLTSPIFGTLGDRRGRPKLLAAGVAIWSVATALGGVAHSFAGLFAARASVGIGEAAYGTIAPALLADHFPIEKRGRIFSVFFAAIPIGAALGYVARRPRRRAATAGAPRSSSPGVAGHRAGAPLPRPRRIRRAARRTRAAPRTARFPASARGRRTCAFSATAPTLLTVLGYAAYTFALGGLAFWAPAFLERVRGMPRSEATVQFGAIVVVTGFVGTFGGGWLGDWWLKRSKSGLPLGLGVGDAARRAGGSRRVHRRKARRSTMAGIVVTELLLFASTGPINSAIVNLVAPGERATAVALSILAIHLLGDVPSPPLIGAISDATSLQNGVPDPPRRDRDRGGDLALAHGFEEEVEVPPGVRRALPRAPFCSRALRDFLSAHRGRGLRQTCRRKGPSSSSSTIPTASSIRSCSSASRPRPVSFLAKAPLFRMPVVGSFVRAFGSIPSTASRTPGPTSRRTARRSRRRGGCSPAEARSRSFPRARRTTRRSCCR